MGGAGQARVHPGAQVQRAGHVLEQRDHRVLFAAGQALPALGLGLQDGISSVMRETRADPPRVRRTSKARLPAS